MACCACCNNPGYQTFNRWTLLVLNLISWIFSIITLTNCNFLTHRYYDSDGDGIGIFRFESSTGAKCQSYDELSTEFEADTPHKVSKAFGVLSCLLLSFALIGSCLVIFVLKEQISKIVWTITRVFFVIAFFFNVATFSFIATAVDSEFCDVDYNDEVTCRLGPGGIITALNFWFLFGIICTCFCVPIPQKPLCSMCCNNGGGCGCCDDNGAATPSAYNDPNKSAAPMMQSSGMPSAPMGGSVTTKTVEVTPEGKKIIVETIHPDGTKTIEESFEPA